MSDVIVQKETWFPNESHPFRWLRKVSNVLCEDGKFRTVTLSMNPDTYFSIPGYVQIYDKESKKRYTITGFIMKEGFESDIYTFKTNKYGKNGHRIPTIHTKETADLFYTKKRMEG